MNIILPERKTYLPGAGSCIYCLPKITNGDLRREHIIPRKLGGEIILHQASCVRCQDQINKEIEGPTLKNFWFSARHKLGLPTSEPVEQLRIGEWDADKPDLPKDMHDANFRFKRIDIENYPTTVMWPRLAPPGILWDRALTKSFHLMSIEPYIGGTLGPHTEQDRKLGIVEPFSPDIVSRSIAKIAHGAAVAVLGIDAFDPFLPEVIMGRDPHISHYIGGKIGKGFKKTTLHEISLTMRGGFVVAQVQLFARLGLRPYIAVVGRLRDHTRHPHLSGTIIVTARRTP